jgi:hypothetical protein
MNTQDKTSLSLTQELTGAVTTANTLKMAVEGLEQLLLFLYQEEETALYCNKFNDIQTAKKNIDECNKKINACKEALEAEQVCQAQEPLYFVYEKSIKGDFGGYNIVDKNEFNKCKVNDKNHKLKLYTHPAQPWQGNKEFVTLTDDELVAKVFDNDELLARILYLDGVSKALKQTLKEKNT